MGRVGKREKPIFAKNVVLRRKALGWNAHQLAQAARIPYPTLRDIEAGVNAGRDSTKEAIAKALGCKSMAELYAKQDPTQQTLRDLFRSLVEAPQNAGLAEAHRLFEQLEAIGPAQRALALAFLAGDYEVARPFLPSDDPILRSYLKAL